MKTVTTSAIKYGTAAFFLSLVLFLAAGCIPTQPEQTQPTAAPVTQPAPAPAALPATSPATGKPSVQAETMPPDSTGAPRASLKIEPQATPNVSVAVEPMAEGTGFNVRGTFNLSGAIVPVSPGKWKFSGQFSMAEPDFEAGQPTATALGTFGPTPNGVAMTMDASKVMIVIPVRPPSARASAGTPERRVPVTLDFDAPDKAEFTVSLSQM